MALDSDPHHWISALRGSHDRLVDMVAEMGEDEVTSASFCSEWSIAQVLSHLGSGAEISRMNLEANLAGEPSPDPDRYPAIWDRWNNKAPLDQARDGISADLRLVRLVEGLDDRELQSIRIELFGGMVFDAVGVLGLRLNEHAAHSWDIGVMRDPELGLAPDATALLVDLAPMFAGWVGRADAVDPVQVRVQTTAPARSFLLAIGDGKVELTPSPGEADLELPAEAFLRLLYGRLHSDNPTVAQLQKVFPGL